jgi:DNA-binding winged helix-turn-helix (wHTH) protein
VVFVVRMKIKFGEYELDEQKYLLERSGERVILRPKVFDLLVHLACNRNRVIRREELVDRLWDATSVGSGSLSGLVNELRQALGEDGRGPSSIRTVHARGYQFVAEVEDPLLRPEGKGDEHLRAARRSSASLVLERVAEEGARGLVIESSGTKGLPGIDVDREPTGEGSNLGALLVCAAQMGFEVHRLFAPHESLASPSRFARQIIDSMIERRGRASIGAALPLPARAWLEDSERSHQSVAGGRAELTGGPPDPLGAIVSLLGGLSRRCPLVILIEDVGSAGSAFAGHLLSLVQRLNREPVLWIGTTKTLSVDDPWLRVLAREGGFERWASASDGRPVLDRSLRRLGLGPLPPVIVEAIDAHVKGNPIALEAVSEWISDLGDARLESDRISSDRNREEVDAQHSSTSSRSPMRTVAPLHVARNLRSADS